MKDPVCGKSKEINGKGPPTSSFQQSQSPSDRRSPAVSPCHTEVPETKQKMPFVMTSWKYTS
jgi:hypothetical protein